jgi:hypothetical protein
MEVTYAQRGSDGRWRVYHDAGDDPQPVSVPLTKAEAEKWVRDWQPECWADIVVVGETFIGPAT